MEPFALFRDFFQYLWDLFVQWTGAATGGTIVALAWLWETYTKKTLSRQTRLRLAVLFLLMASFFAWRTQYLKARATGAYLQAAVHVYYTLKNNPLPKDKPLRFYLDWNNIGNSPAIDPQLGGNIYLLGAAAIGSSGIQETTMIAPWKKEYEDKLKDTEMKEGDPVFPGKTQQFLVSGPDYTQENIDDVNKHTKVIFVIGAVRFTDGLGKHEARFCQYLSDLDEKNKKVEFSGCRSYVKQVDIK
jgi:hypothetical protein